MDETTTRKRRVLITGANGYIGLAVARKFQEAGYDTYGLIRSPKAIATLQQYSITPVVGSAAQLEDTLQTIGSYTAVLDVIVNSTDDRDDYETHFKNAIQLLRALAKRSDAQGVRPLVLFTSGCKDYGQGELAGSSNLVSHTEQSDLNPPAFLRARTSCAIKVLNETSFDAAVLRPTHVHGYSSSLLAQFLEMATNASDHNIALELRADPQTIIHSLNVDDCADAYVALAGHPYRAEVAGECFNISPGRRYETIHDVAVALSNVYNLQKGFRFDPPPSPITIEPQNALLNFSQYVSSEKLRDLTGWRESNPLFAQDLQRYKCEWENSTKA